MTFDFNTRPSVDGISYNGLCHCKTLSATSDTCVMDEEEKGCEGGSDVVRYGKRCFRLYSQGPCQDGAWIAVKRQTKSGHSSVKEGVCECMPGYKERRTSKDGESVECVSPAVILAEFLNKNYYATSVHIKR